MLKLINKRLVISICTHIHHNYNESSTTLHIYVSCQYWHDVTNTQHVMDYHNIINNVRVSFEMSESNL